MYPYPVSPDVGVGRRQRERVQQVAEHAPRCGGITRATAPWEDEVCHVREQRAVFSQCSECREQDGYM